MECSTLILVFLLGDLSSWGHSKNKEEIWLSPMTKPSYQQKIQKSRVTTQKRHQNVDYITIADRLRTSSWSNDSLQNTNNCMTRCRWTTNMETGNYRWVKSTSPWRSRSPWIPATYRICMESVTTTMQYGKGKITLDSTPSQRAVLETPQITKYDKNAKSREGN